MIAAGADPNLQAVVREVNSQEILRCSCCAVRTTQSAIALRDAPTPTLDAEIGGRHLYMAARGSIRRAPAAGVTPVVDTAPAEFRAHPTPMRAAIKLGNPNVLPTLLRGGASNCIGRYERTVQKYLREQSDIEAEAESDEVRQSLRRARSAHRVALLYLHRVAEAGGYRKYERMRRAAVMAMAVRSSKLPAALEIWVQHVADSFPDPLEERRPRGARIRIGYSCPATVISDFVFQMLLPPRPPSRRTAHHRAAGRNRLATVSATVSAAASTAFIVARRGGAASANRSNIGDRARVGGGQRVGRRRRRAAAPDEVPARPRKPRCHGTIQAPGGGGGASRRSAGTSK